MGTDPAGGTFIGLQLGRKLASLPQSRSIDAARRVIDSVRGAVVEHDLAAPGAPSLVEHGITAQTFAGDLAPAEASHVIGQIERVLDAEVLVQNRAAAAESVTTTKGKSMSNAKTPKLNSLAGAFDSFANRVEAAAQKVLDRMESVGGGAETSAAKLDKAIDPIEAIVKNIDDTANQLTNGGPPLDDSAKPQA